MDAREYLKKPYARMVTPDTDGSFFAEIVEFPGCFATGKTATEALENLEGVALDWVNVVFAQGQDVPEPMDSNDYSGKLVLRMTKGLHKRAALWAEREGVSLNQFINTCLAEAVGERARPLIYAQTLHHAVANMTAKIVYESVHLMTPINPLGVAVIPQTMATNSNFLEAPGLKEWHQHA